MIYHIAARECALELRTHMADKEKRWVVGIPVTPGGLGPIQARLDAERERGSRYP